MKKITALFLAAFMIFAATGTLAADVKVLVNGEEMSFDRQPIVEGETVLVPFRAIVEKLGGTVGWHQETKTAFSDCGGTITTLQIGNNLMFLNNEAVTLSVSPIISTDRTLIPTEVIEKATGATVVWDALAATVTVTK